MDVSAVPTHNSIRARLDPLAVGNVRDRLDTTPGCFPVLSHNSANVAQVIDFRFVL
jgi:hypothetical protein